MSGCCSKCQIALIDIAQWENELLPTWNLNQSKQGCNLVMHQGVTPPGCGASITINLTARVKRASVCVGVSIWELHRGWKEKKKRWKKRETAEIKNKINTIYKPLEWNWTKKGWYLFVMFTHAGYRNLLTIKVKCILCKLEGWQMSGLSFK